MPDKPKFSIVGTPKKWLLPSGRYPGKIGRELWVSHLSTIGIGEMACLSIPMCLTPTSGTNGLPE